MSHAANARRGERNTRWKIVSASAASLILFAGQISPAIGNPTGGVVVAGAASIGSAGKTLTINQSTNDAIINWQQFSIASGETTKFLVPTSASATLNRVLGGNPSAIYGTLQSNGKVFLINPSGILVGAGGRIDTAGFLGSTLDVSNAQFLAGGDMHFLGDSTASIDNQGTINAGSGDVYLLANQVDNSGSITAPQGNVGLAAASDILFQQAGAQHLFVQPTPSGTKRALAVSNSGTIRAASAELHAAGGNAYALAINNTGSIAATGYKKINGQVYLTSEAGNISNSGSIVASTSGQGGQIHLASKSGTISNSGKLSASATSSGGKGGAVSLKSIAGAVSNAGGTIDAKGGQGGTGGAVDLSGTTVNGLGTVDTSTPGGTTGTFLIDPATWTVAASGGDETGAQVASALGLNNVTLNADNAVTIDDSITWSAATTLTLSTNLAGSKIAVNSAIDGTGSGSAVTINSAGTVSITGTSITLAGGNLMITGTGFASTTTAPSDINDADGIDVFNSTLNAGGGGITLNGTGGYYFLNGGGGVTGIQSGIGVQLGGAILETSGNGNIGVTGTMALPGSTTSLGSLMGIRVLGAINGNQSLVNSSLSVASGTLTLHGTVTNGSADGDIIGVDVSTGSQVAATGTGGSVSITGNVSGTTELASDRNDGTISSDLGVSIGDGGNALTTVSAGTNGTLTINGIAGTVDGTNSSGFATAGVADGVYISGLTTVSGGTGAHVSITGQTGSATSSGSFSGSADGVNIGGGPNTNGPTIIEAQNNGSVSITGTGGSINTTNDTTPGIDDTPSAEGVDILHTADILGFGNATVTIMGTGGTSIGPIGSAIGVNIGTNSSGSVPTIFTELGALQITGNGGTSSGLGIGVVIRGFNGGSASVTSFAGPLTITGTGGAGYTGTGNIVFDSFPNYGIGISDNVILSDGSGAITLNGTASGNSYGVAILKITDDPAIEANPTDPSITTGGSFTVNSTGGLGALIDAPIIGTTGGTPTPITITETGGNLVLGPDAVLVNSGTGNDVTLVAGTQSSPAGFVINNSNLAGNVLQVSNGAKFFVYSSAPTGDQLNGITASSGDTHFGATFPSNPSAPGGNGALLFFTGGSPSNMPTLTDGSGSNVVPPTTVPQNGQIAPQNPPSGGTPNPGSNGGNGNNGNNSNPGNGGLAGASGNSGQVGAGDAAQLNSGQLNNISNPFASSALNLALGPAVQTALADALGSFEDGSYTPAPDTSNGNGNGDGETILNGGDTAVIGDNGVQNIPASDAPPALQNALGNGVRNGLPSGGGH